MHLLQAFVEAVADWLHASTDAHAHAHAQGLVVQRRPWGGRRVGHPMVGRYAAARRERLLCGDADAVDRMFLDAQQLAGRR
jgi:hypothetical protein